MGLVARKQAFGPSSAGSGYPPGRRIRNYSIHIFSIIFLFFPVLFRMFYVGVAGENLFLRFSRALPIFFSFTEPLNDYYML
jgi:hypothetical protein